MKRRMVRAIIEDEAIYAEVEGHVDAELYEIAKRDGGPIAMRVTKVLELEVHGVGGIWKVLAPGVDCFGKEEDDLVAYLRDRWLFGADQPMVFRRTSQHCWRYQNDRHGICLVGGCGPGADRA